MLQSHADQGNPLAQAVVAHVYSNDSIQIVSNSLDKARHYGNLAIPWLKKKLAEGYKFAQLYWGAFHYYGITMDVNKDESYRFFILAATQGLPAAQNFVGLCHYYGYGTPVDFPKAVLHYRQAIEQGFAAAFYNLGYSFAHGEGVEKDEAAAAELWRVGAEQGYSLSLLALGNCYQYGRGVERNGTESAKWYQLAAEQNDTYAMGKLGHKYFIGDGVPRNLEMATHWFKTAADMGDEYSQYCLGICHLNGHGVPENAVEAWRLIRLSAENGHGEGQRLLGEHIYFGDDELAADKVEGLKWMRQASEKKLTSGVLGAHYMDTEIDFIEAVHWLNKAIAEGDGASHANLAVCCVSGLGTIKDAKEARRLMKLAADKGVEGCDETLEEWDKQKVGISEEEL